MLPPDPDDARATLIRNVVTGDSDAIDDFLLIADGVSSPDLPQFAILPKSTITITATVGASLPPETRLAIPQ
jgi:hypothetical protein